MVTEVAKINGFMDDEKKAKKTNKKRKKCSLRSNPLSDARKAARCITADSKAATLWNLKCGSGSFLFLSYYAKQPAGVVVHRAAGDEEILNVTHKSNIVTARAGQSRAAKRRRKQRTKNETSSLTEGQNGVVCSLEVLGSTDNNLSLMNSSIDPNGAPYNSSKAASIMHAFQSMRQSWAHLTPFVNALSQPLPLTFRLRNLDSQSEQQQQKQQILVKDLSANHAHLVRPVVYSSVVYQSFCPTAMCHKKKVEASLYKTLMEASSSGLLARQEVGSILPVGLLHAGGWLSKKTTILDMCASPGSKTLQAFEISKHIVANEIHPTRLQALQSAIERSGLVIGTTGLTFTQMDASVFPIPASNKKKFDVVVADVPCSGDGTIRKDPRTLSIWNPHTATILHELQVRILEQALRVVKVGGVVSYSTCSFNPIENEAVVAAVLRKISSPVAPVVKLIEWPTNAFPGLIRRSGVDHWLVADCIASTAADRNDDDNSDNDGEQDEAKNPIVLRWHDSYENAVSAGMEYVEKSLWPPNTDERQTFDLNRCTRLWPQDQDTGGFFVALLKKTGDII